MSKKKKNGQVMKKGKIGIKILAKEEVNILRLPAKTQKQARAHAHVITTLIVIGWLNYIFECNWLIELSDNKLSNNKLSNNKLSDNNLASKLVENRTFFKPITGEGIVIFMINYSCYFHTCYFHVWRYDVFWRKLTWYFTGVYILKIASVYRLCSFTSLVMDYFNLRMECFV